MLIAYKAIPNGCKFVAPLFNVRGVIYIWTKFDNAWARDEKGGWHAMLPMFKVEVADA